MDLLNEKILFNEKDIYYNKDKFDSGEINLCFIIGHSGSGKSTMANSMEKNGIEKYELDDLQVIADHFTMENLKEYGDLIYSYFKGPGKKFYITYKELVDNKIPESEYEDKLFPGFIEYAKSYAKSHKDKKYVIEGVWIVDYCEPSEFKDYAFYIKGTSALISRWRAAKRDSKDADSKLGQFAARAKNFFNPSRAKQYLTFEKDLNKFRDYFKSKVVDEAKQEILYRVTYNGIGIYEAYKQNVDKNTWLSFLNTKAANWLPKPEVYQYDKCYSYFTEEGYKMFKKYTLPVFEKVLDKNKIETHKESINGKEVYRDKYQVVFSSSINESYIEEANDYTKYDSSFKEKKIDFKYRSYDINSKQAKSYIESNSYTKKYLDYLSENTGEILVDTDNDKLIGYIFVGKSKDKGFISTLEVVQDYRGYGFGKELLKDAINKYNAIDLVVYKDNKVALDMYKKFGFAIIGEDKNGKAWYMKLRSKLSKDDKIIHESYIEEANVNLYKRTIDNPTLERSIGFVSSDNIYNENVYIKEYNKPLRGRSELLIIDGNKVLLNKSSKGYTIPGGGWEKGEDHNLSAEREANEECKVKVKNISYMSTYAAIFPPKDWVKEKISKENWWYGEYCEVYCATYDGKYKEKVDLIDQDKNMESNSKFYDIDSVQNLLIDQHKKAIENYKKTILKESYIDESTIDLSDIERELNEMSDSVVEDVKTIRYKEVDVDNKYDSILETTLDLLYEIELSNYIVDAKDTIIEENAVLLNEDVVEDSITKNSCKAIIDRAIEDAKIVINDLISKWKDREIYINNSKKNIKDSYNILKDNTKPIYFPEEFYNYTNLGTPAIQDDFIMKLLLLNKYTSIDTIDEPLTQYKKNDFIKECMKHYIGAKNYPTTFTSEQIMSFYTDTDKYYGIIAKYLSDIAKFRQQLDEVYNVYKIPASTIEEQVLIGTKISLLIKAYVIDYTCRLDAISSYMETNNAILLETINQINTSSANIYSVPSDQLEDIDTKLELRENLAELQKNIIYADTIVTLEAAGQIILNEEAVEVFQFYFQKILNGMNKVIQNIQKVIRKKINEKLAPFIGILKAQDKPDPTFRIQNYKTFNFEKVAQIVVPKQFNYQSMQDDLKDRKTFMDQNYPLLKDTTNPDNKNIYKILLNKPFTIQMKDAQCTPQMLNEFINFLTKDYEEYMTGLDAFYDAIEEASKQVTPLAKQFQNNTDKETQNFNAEQQAKNAAEGEEDIGESASVLEKTDTTKFADDKTEGGSKGEGSTKLMRAVTLYCSIMSSLLSGRIKYLNYAYNDRLKIVWHYISKNKFNKKEENK